jgi:hypothetical protein
MPYPNDLRTDVDDFKQGEQPTEHVTIPWQREDDDEPTIVRGLD